MSQTVTVKRFRYSLDWFHTDDVECEVGPNWSYEMQFRLGSWFLCARYYDHVAGQWFEDYSKSFQLEQPFAAVVSLGNRLTKFSKLHECNLVEHVTKLMADVEGYKVVLAARDEVRNG